MSCRLSVKAAGFPSDVELAGAVLSARHQAARIVVLEGLLAEASEEEAKEVEAEIAEIREDIAELPQPGELTLDFTSEDY
eukprot:SAG22_NODE_20476_length_265_cov_0.933735_1_plen_79_part_10